MKTVAATNQTSPL